MQIVTEHTKNNTFQSFMKLDTNTRPRNYKNKIVNQQSLWWHMQTFLTICYQSSMIIVVFAQSLSCVQLWPHRLQHARLPCPSPSPGVDSNPCLLSQWCHPTTSSTIALFSSCLQSFPASGPFQMSQFFASGGQSVGASASASVLPVNFQGLFLLGLTGLNSLQPKGLSRVPSSTTFQKHQFFSFLYDPILMSHNY